MMQNCSNNLLFNKKSICPNFLENLVFIHFYLKQKKILFHDLEFHRTLSWNLDNLKNLKSVKLTGYHIYFNFGNFEIKS